MIINNKTSLYLSCSSSPGNFGATLYNYFFEKKNINSIYLPRFCDHPEEMVASIKAKFQVLVQHSHKVPPALDEATVRRAQRSLGRYGLGGGVCANACHRVFLQKLDSGGDVLVGDPRSLHRRCHRPLSGLGFYQCDLEHIGLDRGGGP